jgi:hypothetical protein
VDAAGEAAQLVVSVYPALPHVGVAAKAMQEWCCGNSALVQRWQPVLAVCCRLDLCCGPVLDDATPLLVDAAGEAASLLVFAVTVLGFVLLLAQFGRVGLSQQCIGAAQAACAGDLLQTSPLLLTGSGGRQRTHSGGCTR